MRIAIFGANGATGRLLTQSSLTAEHTVSALLRTPEAFPLRDRVAATGQVIQGSAFDPVAVARTLQGADVVLSVLGAKSPLRNENVLPRAVPVIIEAMQQASVKRIIVLGSAGALPDSLTRQPAWRQWIVKNIVYAYFLKWPVYEQTFQYLALVSSGLDWTMVMPPMLTNGPAHGSYRIDSTALPPNGNRISRADITQFMMQQITSTDWLRKAVYISD